MKNSIEVDTNQSIARVTLHGELVRDEFLALYEEVLLHPQFLPKMSVIWDARDASAIRLTSSDLQRIGNVVREKILERGEGKAAWVVSADFEYGMGRMFELMTEGYIPVTFRVFRSMEEANKWAME